MKLSIDETIKWIDQTWNNNGVPHEMVGNFGNDGIDRDLQILLIKHLMFEAYEQGWYHHSIWVTGARTADMINQLFHIEAQRGYNQTISQRFPMIFYDRPMIVEDMWVMSDTIPRLYLLNYGDKPYYGCVLGDLQ